MAIDSSNFQIGISETWNQQKLKVANYEMISGGRLIRKNT
ncbi:hypothetical protein LEP1GSC017_1753 [Leptospira meyeri serovar Hardjo str. Went 5]|nr:hypothetical protein LEP1GSC017_1753 [Leptospira meyeri serovar Hardjo str. Went 5]EMJ88665.1 hypothetical protein LEP1GSC196_1661 [Leptospira meyeri serovar Semaranga str. Veldrot Semarang 173]